MTGRLLLTVPGGTRGTAGKLEVAIRNTVNSRFELRVVETASDGSYSVPNLAPGAFVNIRLDELRERPAAYTQPCAAWAMMNAATVVDMEIVAVGSQPTKSGSPTLSGTVYRSTSAGRVPVANTALLFDASCDDGSIDAGTATDAQGRFAFCTLPPGKGCVYSLSTEFKAQIVDVDIRGDATIDIDVDPPPPPPPANIDGNYTLELESSCAALPTDVRRRNYAATITGSPNALVTLGGAAFWSHPSAGLLNTFSGSVAGDGVSFNLSAPAAPEFGIVERTSETSLLEFLGRGDGTITSTGIEGRLRAGVGFGEDIRDDARHVGCGPAEHQATFRLTRR